MLSVAVVAIGIAVELLDAPGQAAAQQVQRSATNTQVASRVVIGKQIAGRTVVGQALRLLVAAALRAAFERTGEERSNSALRTAKRLQFDRSQPERVRNY